MWWAVLVTVVVLLVALWIGYAIAANINGPVDGDDETWDIIR